MEELTLSIEEVIRNLHFIPCIEQEILNAFSRKEKKMQEIAETAYSGTDYAFPLLKRSPSGSLSITEKSIYRVSKSRRFGGDHLGHVPRCLRPEQFNVLGYRKDWNLERRSDLVQSYLLY